MIPGVVHGNVAAPPPYDSSQFYDGDIVDSPVAYQSVVNLNAYILTLPCTGFPPFELGGLVLTSGVYCNGGGFDIGSTLTLDAAWSTAARFVFVAGSQFSIGTLGNIAFINGAQPCQLLLYSSDEFTVDGYATGILVAHILNALFADVRFDVTGRVFADHVVVEKALTTPGSCQAMTCAPSCPAGRFSSNQNDCSECPLGTFRCVHSPPS